MCPALGPRFLPLDIRNTANQLCESCLLLLMPSWVLAPPRPGSRRRPSVSAHSDWSASGFAFGQQHSQPLKCALLTSSWEHFTGITDTEWRVFEGPWSVHFLTASSMDGWKALKLALGNGWRAYTTVMFAARAMPWAPREDAAHHGEGLRGWPPNQLVVRPRHRGATGVSAVWCKQHKVLWPAGTARPAVGLSAGSSVWRRRPVRPRCQEKLCFTEQ